MPTYTIEVATYGKQFFGGIEADSEEEAIKKFWEKMNEVGMEPDETEEDYGYPCHTGWPVASAEEE